MWGLRELEFFGDRNLEPLKGEAAIYRDGDSRRNI